MKTILALNVNTFHWCLTLKIFLKNLQYRMMIISPLTLPLLSFYVYFLSLSLSHTHTHTHTHTLSLSLVLSTFFLSFSLYLSFSVLHSHSHSELLRKVTNGQKIMNSFAQNPSSTISAFKRIQQQQQQQQQQQHRYTVQIQLKSSVHVWKIWNEIFGLLAFALLWRGFKCGPYAP